MHGVVYYFETGLGGIQLCQGRGDHDRAAALDVPGIVIYHIAHILKLDTHINYLLLDELEAAYCFSKLYTLSSVTNGFIIRRLSHAQDTCCAGQAFYLKVFHKLVEAAALNSHQSGLIHLNVIKIDFAGVARPVPDLAQRLYRDAGGVKRDKPHAHVLGRYLVFIIPHHTEHIRRDVGAGIKCFMAVDIDLSVSPRGGRGHSAVVRSRLRFGEAKRKGFAAGLCNVYDKLLLFRVSEGEDILNFQRGVGPAEGGKAQPCRLLADHELSREVGPGPAVFLRHAEQMETVVHHYLDGAFGIAMFAIALPYVVIQVVLLVYFSQALKQEFLFFRFSKIHIAAPFAGII